MAKSEALVVFQPSGRRGRFLKGIPVLRAAQQLGVYVESVCGGRGLCGRCQIKVAEGKFAKYGVTSGPENLTPIGDQETRFREAKPLADDRRLSCSTLIRGDLVIEIPSDARANARREAEAAIARRIIQQQIIPRGYEPVVLGDLNDYDRKVADRDPLRSSKTRVLENLKDFDPAREGAELFNVAGHIRRPEDRVTSHWDRNENGVADSDDVYTMIDHILLPNALKKHMRRTFVCRLTELSTSDHWPLVVDLVLPEATEEPPGGTK